MKRAVVLSTAATAAITTIHTGATSSCSTSISMATTARVSAQATRQAGPAWSGSCCSRVENKIMIRFDRNICGDLDAAIAREWLETNGLGGFSSSTIAGMNTRRYHGLLTAATKPPVGRFLLLSKFEE